MGERRVSRSSNVGFEDLRVVLKRCLLLLLLALTAHAQEPPLEIVVSPTHHLYYLLECLLDQPHRSPQMAQTFRARVGDWTPVQEALEGWRSSLEGEGLALLRLPRYGARSINLGDALERVALDSSNAQDMARRASPWLGPEHAARLGVALSVLEPLQRHLWWDQGAAQLDLRKRELQSDLARGDFSASMQRARAFFCADWDPLDPPRLALIPYQTGLEEQSVTHGHSQGGLQVLEVVIDEPDPDAAGTVFHEFVHFLWQRRPELEAKRWQTAFYSKGPWGRAAYVQLNEGLATALGNGWFAARVLDGLDPGSWYADPVIDAYGHALMPIVSQVMEESRPPTEAELQTMVEAFRTAVPDALNRFDVVAADFAVVGSRAEMETTAFQNEIMRLGPVRWSRTRGWDDEPTEATFQVLWLKPEERRKLNEIGWPGEVKTFALRQTDQGWQLAFFGDQAELFALLRTLKKTKLSPISG